MRVVSIEVEVSVAMNDCYVNPALHEGANPRPNSALPHPLVIQCSVDGRQAPRRPLPLVQQTLNGRVFLAEGQGCNRVGLRFRSEKI
jgi:hypothetical protein